MTLADRVKAGAAIAGTATARILIIDIERVPGTALLWDPKPNYVSPHQWTSKPRTICAAWQWYGTTKIHFGAEWQRAGRDAFVQATWDAFDKADVVVTYNGKSFDTKALAADWIAAGLPQPSPWKNVDLYRIVRQQFMWTSRSMDSVCAELGLDGKSDRYDMHLALAACNGDRDAQRRIKAYNEGDIQATGALYDRLRGWMPNHPHLGRANDTPICNQCSSTNLTAQGKRYKAQVISYVLYRCDDCGANVRGGWHSRQAVTRGVNANAA